MGTLGATIAALAIDQTKYKNQRVQAARQKVLVAYGNLLEAAAAVDSDNDETTEPVAAGTLRLAGTFGKLWPSLSQDQKDEIKDEVAEIVTGASEAKVEAVFNAGVEFIGATQEETQLIDSLVDADPTEGQ